jgi:hypothetical protein
VIGTTARPRRASIASISAVAGTALALSLTACSAQTAQSAREEALIPQLKITPGNGARAPWPGTRVTVRAVNGRLRGVRVQTVGEPVGGRLGGNGTIWRSQQLPRAASQFTVTATVAGPYGRFATVVSSFRTGLPRRSFAATILRRYRQRNGISTPIVVTFSRPITRKAAVQRAIRMRTSRRVTGSWHWAGKTALYFQPRRFWPPRTRVTLDARLNGVAGAPGVYGTRDLRQTFEIRPVPRRLG